MQCNNEDMDWFGRDMSLPTPISMTHAALQEGRQQQVVRKLKPKLVDFQSYTTKNFRSKSEANEMDTMMQDCCDKSTYRRDYTKPYPSVYCIKEEKTTADPLMNRKTKNQFIMQASADSKFMDDHLSQRSPARKKIDFFRQMRNISIFDKPISEQQEYEVQNTSCKPLKDNF